MVRDAAVDSGLVACDIHVPPESDLAAKARVLYEHFLTQPLSALADCTECKASSLKSLSVCPFCGLGEDGSEAVEPAPDATPESEEPEAAERGDASIEIDPDNLPATEPEEPKPLVDAKAVRKKAVKEAKAVKPAKALPAQDAAAKAITKPKAAEAQVVGSDGKPMTVEQLHQDIAEIKKIRVAYGAATWMIATRISSLFETDRWKLLREKGNKPKYKRFDQFVKEELGMSREYAATFPKIISNFTEAEFNDIGISKLRLLMSVKDKEKQKKLLKDLKGGASRRNIEREIGRKETSGKVTVASLEGRHTVRMRQKPAKKTDDLSESKPAKRLADAPYGYLDLANDMRLWFEIVVDGKGEIVVKTEFRRLAD